MPPPADAMRSSVVAVRQFCRSSPKCKDPVNRASCKSSVQNRPFGAEFGVFHKIREHRYRVRGAALLNGSAAPPVRRRRSVTMMEAITLRRTARAIAWGRIAIGGTALVAPPIVTRPWVGDSADTSSARLLARTLGGRDLALGVGTLRALSRSDEEARPWVALAGVSDAVDALATAIAFAWLPRRTRWVILGVCVGAALVSIRAAASLDTGPDAEPDSGPEAGTWRWT
jgi:hypothetical protein